METIVGPNKQDVDLPNRAVSVDLGCYPAEGEDRLLGGGKAGYNIRGGYLAYAGKYP